MNPNAVVYLKEVKGQGTPSIAYRLCEFANAAASIPRHAHQLHLSLLFSLFFDFAGNGEQKVFEITPKMSADEALAKLLKIARDPELDEPTAAATSTKDAGAAAATAAAAAAPVSGAAAEAAKPLR
jgi:hypothetical protein